jgi:hypothetical protein
MKNMVKNAYIESRARMLNSTTGGRSQDVTKRFSGSNPASVLVPLFFQNTMVTWQRCGGSTIESEQGSGVRVVSDQSEAAGRKRSSKEQVAIAIYAQPHLPSPTPKIV